MRLSHYLHQGDLNFVLTNVLPRKWLTRLVRQVSRSEWVWVKGGALALWRSFAKLDLSDAATTDFKSLHDCFTRKLRPGARPIATDAACLVSPCDGLVGACGRIAEGTLLQAKGSEYPLAALLGDAQLAAEFRDGVYVTLRLTSSMYHRFHAPDCGTVERVTFFPGELWNVNPPTLKRIRHLFVKNERAVLRTRLRDSGRLLALVPVGAVLVGSIRLAFLDHALDQTYRGPREIACRAAFRRGEELGWFEHGSTVIVLAPQGFELAPAVREGATLRMGQVLLRQAMR